MSENEAERDRGILTPTDREFLRGEKKYPDKQTTAHRRADIRQRLHNSILDISLILDELPEDDLRKAIEKKRVTAKAPLTVHGETPIRHHTAENGDTVGVVDEQIERGLYNMLLLLYRILLIEDRIAENSDKNPFSELVEQAHEDAILRYKSGVFVEEIDHTVETVNRDSLASIAQNRYEQNEPLTAWQTKALLESNYLSDEEIGEYVRSFTEETNE
jgi:hypothetical protein